MRTALLLLSIFLLRPAFGEDLAATAIAKCCDSIQQISSIRCQVLYNEYKGSSDPVVANKAMYYRKNEVIRIVEDCTLYIDNQKQTTTLDVFCDGKLTKQTNQSGAAVTGGIRSPLKPNSSKCDAFNHCLFNVLTPRYSAYKPAQEFFRLLKITSAKRIKDKKDRDVIEIYGECKIDDLDCNYTIHFDESWNYIVTAMAIDCRITDQRKVRHQFNVDIVSEIAPGIYIPTNITRETYLSGDLLWFSKVVISNIVVNSPIPQHLLIFKFPHGVEIYDSINSSKYRVDENGNRISPQVTVEAGGLLTPRNTDDASTRLYTHKSSSKEEYTPLWHYVPYLFGIIFLVTLVALIWKKVRVQMNR